MHLIDQLPVARLISAGQLDQAIEVCERKLARNKPRPDLTSALMLCYWWRGEHEVAFELAQQILLNSKSPERSAVEVASSYCATRPNLTATVANVQRLADASLDEGAWLILCNPAWFARSISQNRSERIDTRVRRAVTLFTTTRLEHIQWANAWLAGDQTHRKDNLPPPI